MAITKTVVFSVGVLVLTVAGGACRSANVASRAPIVQPGAPGESTQVISAVEAVDLSKVGHTAADVKFMQGMIGHHSQAVEMVELLKARTASEDMKLLGLRIELSQEDEIKMMERWLQAQGVESPSDPPRSR